MTPEPGLFRPVLEAEWFGQAERRLRRGETGVALVGLVEGARSLVLTLLAHPRQHAFGVRYRLVWHCLAVAPEFMELVLGFLVEGRNASVDGCLHIWVPFRASSRSVGVQPPFSAQA